MPRLKVLSAKEVIGILENQGFSVASQKGSHIKLRRNTSYGTEILTIPNHKEIDRGTLKAIFNQTLKFIPEDVLRNSFYTD
ncbi:MAG: type II toxin-antitoxin system HicA family toxin [Candidatus Kaiserbacteria bacterium]|nr:type II toxin-antitoxin system HicA family toxin [Candidatus Kaiserbacteria bacterium]